MSIFIQDPKIAHMFHFVMEWLAIAVAVYVYKKSGSAIQHQNFSVAQRYGLILGCILGAGIGNKLMFVFEMPELWQIHGFKSLFLGQSIVGGMLGALIGIEIAKKIVKIQSSTGDGFVLPLIVGTLVGRVGCFLAGLHDGTYGNETTFFWGVDLGDGVLRHPVQVYEMLYVIIVGLLLKHYYPSLKKVSGLTFKLYLVSYLLWRLIIDGFKPIPYEYVFGLSGIQLVCVIALVIYVPIMLLSAKPLLKRMV